MEDYEKLLIECIEEAKTVNRNMPFSELKPKHLTPQDYDLALVLFNRRLDMRRVR